MNDHHTQIIKIERIQNQRWYKQVRTNLSEKDISAIFTGSNMKYDI